MVPYECKDKGALALKVTGLSNGFFIESTVHILRNMFKYAARCLAVQGVGLSQKRANLSQEQRYSSRRHTSFVQSATCEPQLPCRVEVFIQLPGKAVYDARLPIGVVRLNPVADIICCCVRA